MLVKKWLPGVQKGEEASSTNLPISLSLTSFSSLPKLFRWIKTAAENGRSEDLVLHVSLSETAPSKK